MEVSYAHDGLDYYLPELEDSGAGVSSAPSLMSHVSVWVLLLVFSVPAGLLLWEGEIFIGIVLLAVPFIAICFINPFLGLCLLFMASPVDAIFATEGGFATGSKLMAVPIGLGFLLHLLRAGHRFHVPREVKIIGVLTIWALVVLLWSPYRLRAAIASSSLVLLPLLVVVVLGLARSRAHLMHLLNYSILGSVIAAIIALESRGQEIYQRATITGINENHFSYALAFGLLSMIFAFTQSRRRLAKFAYILGMLILSTGIIGTQSRGRFVALIGALFVSILVAYRDRLLKVMQWFFILVLVLFLTAFITAKSGLLAQEAIDRLTEPVSEAGATRFAIWRTGYEAGIQRPFRGFGFSTFLEFSGGRDAHNVYLQLFVELGIPGLFLWLVVLLSLAWGAFRLRHRGACFFATALVTTIVLTGVTMGALTAKTTWYAIGVILVVRLLYGTPKESEAFGLE